MGAQPEYSVHIMCSFVLFGRRRAMSVISTYVLGLYSHASPIVALLVLATSGASLMLCRRMQSSLWCLRNLAYLWERHVDADQLSATRPRAVFFISQASGR